ncbi:MAG TPA: 50S ribosomal protein L18 [Thermoanaerobaculia bacterium]|jgi:large subunit ribosomal protein L18|nr:50S ribosomal protein L18 [Thermoanaerobaculia bacterium]
MAQAKSRGSARDKVRRRIRSRVQGTAERPRLSIFKSLKHLYAQVIDDKHGVTLVSASSLDAGFTAEQKGGGNVAAAKKVGELVARRAKEKGVTRVVFDRGGYPYHGKVKALADSARENGLEF